MKMTPYQMAEVLKDYTDSIECDGMDCEDCPLDAVCCSLSDIGTKLLNDEVEDEEQEEELDSPEVYEAVKMLAQVKNCECYGMSCNGCPFKYDVTINGTKFTCISLAIVEMADYAMNRMNS